MIDACYSGYGVIDISPKPPTPAVQVGAAQKAAPVSDLEMLDGAEVAGEHPKNRLNESVISGRHQTT